MTNLNLEFGFLVPKNVIYEALTHPMTIMQYTRAPAKVQPKEGGEFVLLEGQDQGPNEYIKMEWKLNEWSEYSIVQIILKSEEEDDECEIMVNQAKIPASEKKQKLQYGWKEYYFGAMSKICGYPQKK